MLNIKILKLLNLLESLHFQHFEMICTDESSTDDQKWMNNVNSEFWCHVDFNKKIVQTIRVLMTYRTHHLTLVLIHWPSGYKTRDQTSHSTLHSCPWRDIISRPCLWASQLWVYGYASQSSSSSAVGCCGAGRGGITSDILANAPPELAGASDESPPSRALTRDTCQISTVKNTSGGMKTLRLRVSNAPFLRMANLLKRSDIRFPPLTAAPTEKKDNIDYAKGNIHLFFNDFYTLHGFRRWYTLRGCKEMYQKWL